MLKIPLQIQVLKNLDYKIRKNDFRAFLKRVFRLPANICRYIVPLVDELNENRVFETVAVATLYFEFEILIALSCEVSCSVSFVSHYVSGIQRCTQ